MRFSFQWLLIFLQLWIRTEPSQVRRQQHVVIGGFRKNIIDDARLGCKTPRSGVS